MLQISAPSDITVLLVVILSLIVLILWLNDNSNTPGHP